MIEKIINTQNDRLIRVYDDVFSYQERSNLLKFIRNSRYKTDGSDTSENDYQIFSNFSDLDLENFGIKDMGEVKSIFNIFSLDQREIKQIRVNFSTPAERNRIHADGFGITLLYYVNLDWQIEWGGHTLFLNETLDEAQHVSFYKPNRIVVFDGSIPHMIMTPSSLCPVVRYSFAIQFGNVMKEKE